MSMHAVQSDEPACREGRCGVLRDDEGLTTAGMALSLLLTLALVFSAAQAWRIQSAASEVQNVADAAALAAQNEVAEFMIVVRVCDAVVLTLSLTSLAASGLGLVACCIPGGAGVGQTLLSAARSVSEARATFASRATSALNRLQQALPFVAAVNAAAVARANDGTANRYLAVALLSPLTAPSIAVDDDDSESVEEAVSGGADELQEDANEAKRALEDADAAKRTAFHHDCGAAASGASPGYCLYERAAVKAGLSGTANPLCHSVDTWSFSVAMARAKRYYAARLQQEAPENDSVEEVVRSVMRKKMFAYASALINAGYVHETDSSFDAYFPLMPKNTDEMRTTSLYTDNAYPYGDNGEDQTIMHAWAGCPNAGDATAWGSIQLMESEGFVTCPTCDFTAASLGKVFSASSTINNGFEYHYRIVADQAEKYQRAKNAAAPAIDAVKDGSEGLFDALREALEEAGGQRIEATPPGSKGVVALVANVGSQAADAGFSSLFAASGGTLRTRAALSAATLVEDPGGEGESVIASFLDNVAADAGLVGGAADAVLGCWSALLQGYSQGHSALVGAVRDGLNGLPLMESTGLGTWAADKLSALIESLGLAPADVDALRPVVVNTAHVASADGSAVGARLVDIKRQAVAFPLQSLDLFSSLITGSESAALQGAAGLSSGIEIARIEISGLGISVPVTIALPPCVSQAASDLVVSLADQVRGIYGSIAGVRVWE